MGALQDDIGRKARWLPLLASMNHAVSYSLTLLAALSSILASVSVLSGLFDKGFNAVLAAVPAAVLILQNAVKFEERSRWQFNKSYQVKDLLYQLEHGKNPDDVRVQYLELNTQMLTAFPRFTVAASPKGDAGKEKSS
jgi:hypothetical protein